MRYLTILIGVVCAFSTISQALGDDIPLNLVGVNPTGMVVLTSTSSNIMPSGSGGNYYAGVLNWSTDSSSTPDYWTYCVDVSSVIGYTTGENPPAYTFTPEPLSSLTPTGVYTQNVLSGIQNLWDNNYATFVATLSGSSTDNSDAEELQIALWDIIYNAGSLSPTMAGLLFSSDTSDNLNAALDQANYAYNDQGVDGTGTAAAYEPGLTALQAVGTGQNQIYLSMTPVPLPGAMESGLVLLVAVAGFKAYRKMATA